MSSSNARIFEDTDFQDHVQRLAKANGGKVEITNIVKVGFDGTDLGIYSLG